jgi:type IV pilus assembly protein PilE
MKRQAKGFTILELLTVVAILGIISMVAIPSYQDYVRKGKRAEGRIALLAAAQSQERYFTANNTYTTNLSAAGIPSYSGTQASSAAYTISVVAGAAGIATSFTAKATPANNFSDPKCNILTYTHTSTKGMESATETDPAKCWQ